MAKVKVKFRVNTDDYYNPTKYITRTLEMPLPTNSNGFILFDTLSQNVNATLKEKIIPDLKEPVSLHSVIWWQIQ